MRVIPGAGGREVQAGVDLLRLNTVSRRAVPPPRRAAGSSARWTSRGQRHAARFLPCGHHARLGALVIKRIELQMDASGEVTKALDLPACACAMRGMAIPSATAHCGLLVYPFPLPAQRPNWFPRERHPRRSADFQPAHTTEATNSLPAPVALCFPC